MASYHLNRQLKMRPANKKHAKSQTMGSIRIISGQWRGKKLPVHDVEGLRPTTDRVKETVFNWLMHDVANARCLDCFAGSGALGFEAASRYAEHVLMLEKSPTAFKQLQQNIRAVSGEQMTCKQVDTLEFLKQPGEPVDLVFVDPPFNKGLAQKTVDLLVKHNWLKEGTLLYIEVENNAQLFLDSEKFKLNKSKQTKTLSYFVYEVVS